MSTVFSYRILNYIHSQLLDEKINVGILFYFEDKKRFVFRYPKNFKRIRELYSDFYESQLKSSLRALEEKVYQVNKYSTELFFSDNEEKLVAEILKKDATVLRFSEPKRYESNFKSTEKVAEDFYYLYFSNYKSGFVKEKHNEEYLLRLFKQKLIHENINVDNLLEKNIQIKAPKTTIKFEYQWRNGIVNLIKPISFDLEEENSINSKAILYHGILNFISDEIRARGSNIDLLIAAPSKTTKSNNSLISAYYNAIDILSGAKVKKNIIEEKDVDRYVERVVSTIHKPDGTDN